MHERQIVKAKLTKKNTLDVEYLEVTDDEGAKDSVIREGSHEVHPDLLAVLNEMRIHAATICDQADFTAYEDDPAKLEAFNVTGVVFGGEGEHAGLTLIARRLLKSNQVLNLNTPFVKLNPENSDYNYVASLAALADKFREKVDAYLSGEYAPTSQLNLFDAPEEEAEAEEVVEKPRGKGRRLKHQEEEAA